VAQFDEDDMKFLSTSMLHAGQRAMYCGMGTGQLAVSDLRARAKPVLYQLHDKTIRAVDVSPGDPNLLLTGSIDTTVALWDARKLKGKPLASWEHGRGVTSARFRCAQRPAPR
jgi:WD40 repeat protein